MKQSSTQVSSPVRPSEFKSIIEKEGVIEIAKILVFGSVFPLIYLLGKFFTQL